MVWNEIRVFRFDKNPLLEEKIGPLTSLITIFRHLKYSRHRNKI